MTPDELACTLSEMYYDSADGEATTMTHLFGIKHADEIRNCGAPVTEIISLSGLPNRNFTHHPFLYPPVTP